MWGIPSPYKLGAQNHLFSTTLQLNDNFNVLYLHNRANVLETTRGLLYTLSKCHQRLSTNGFKLDRHFTHPLLILHSLAGFADGDQQTEVNQTLPNGGQ